MAVLTIIDVVGTQDYIFGTNKLRENIGASEIVAQATETWVRELARDKVIYCGGGNALIMFDDPTKAKEFAQNYTKKLLQDAPSLDVVLTHSEPFEIDSFAEIEIPTDETDDFGEPITIKEKVPKIRPVVDETFQKLNEKKSNRHVSAPLVGLAVSAQCVSTGGVANDFDPKSKKYISIESSRKLRIADEDANVRLRTQLFEDINLAGLEIPLDFDDLGRTEGEASFIAVVHTDGNRMGNRIKEYGQIATSNEDWMTKMRELSKSIRKANLDALKETLNVLREHIIKNDKNIWIFESGNGDSFELGFNKEGTRQFFPLRPLIFGGDDLTFVCDGRIALAITAFYLRELMRKNEKEEFVHQLSDGKPLYARAGIAIVKSHYPFSRAYELAEDLAKSAKRRIAEVDEDKPEKEKGQVYALDWHVAVSGLFGTVKEIRERQYTVPQGKLNMRPLSLEKGDWKRWENFKNVIREFQTPKKWKDKRNKVKALREALRGGSEETKKFLLGYQIGKLPEIKGRSGIENDGWNVSNICGYFDAIEMLDLYFPLKDGSATNLDPKGETAE